MGFQHHTILKNKGNIRWSFIASRSLLTGIALLILSGAKPPTPPDTFTNSLGMQFAYIPAGSFEMGISQEQTAKLENPAGSKTESPRYSVRITRPFYLQTTEVTQGQWNKLMKGYTESGSFQGHAGGFALVRPAYDSGGRVCG
ncbi:MAG: hypothetical protein CVV27_14060 [Candidatus Melainabacteria bacterium HGW-Melainabacteria-1]|nr:MAG: hypothetical protein CVV27_14060 [Candidatus Melainabacteria bacterium HGW-Melainabacteria-1]